MWSLQQYRHHVYGRNVLVKTDSSVLKYVFDREDANKNHRLSRWVMEFWNYYINIEHLKGTANAVADALFRNPIEDPPNPFEGKVMAIIPGGYEPRELAILQHADPEIRTRVLTLQGIGECQHEDNKDFSLVECILCKRNTRPGRQHLLMVPSALRQELIREYHDAPTSGHMGREKTLARLSQHYYWPSTEKSEEHYIRFYLFFPAFKSREGRKAGKLHPIKPPTILFE